MKYLVTGGCGFLGSNLSVEVLERNQTLIVLDNMSRIGSWQNLDWLRKKGDFRFIHGDIRSREDVELVVREEKPQIIFHLAGQVAMTTSVARPFFDFSTNLIGTLNLLEAVRLYAPETIVVYSSTNKVYGDLEWVRYEELETRYVAPDFPDGFDESIPLSFHSPYGCSKGAADQYMLDYHRMYGIRTVVFRHSSMYGGRQFSTYDQGWIGWFCSKAIEIRDEGNTVELTISGNGKQVRDILFVSDITELYFSVENRIDTLMGYAFNIGGGLDNSLSILELFQFIEEKLQIKLNFRRLAPRRSDQKLYISNNNSINAALSWHPTIEWKMGLKQMLLWLEK